MQQDLNRYLSRVFSSDNKNKLKTNINKIASDYLTMNRSIEVYISIGNLIIAIRSLSEWQEQVVEVIKSKLMRSTTCTEMYLLDLYSMCEDKKFFSFLGYDQLSVNIDFLLELMTALKSSRNAFNYRKEFKYFSNKVDGLKSRLDLHRSETDEAYVEQHKLTISEMKYYEFSLIKSVVFISSFSKCFSSQLQTAIINELHNYQPSEETGPIEFGNAIVACIKNLPAVKSFIEDAKNFNFDEEFFKDLLYPPLPTHKNEIGRQSLADLNSQFASRLTFY
jgi:hypothetical protein